MPLDTSRSLAHWSRVKALFEEAQACPPAARAAFLDAACTDDGRPNAALRHEVERLLAFDAGADDFFDALITDRPARFELTDARRGWLPSGRIQGRVWGLR